MRKFLHTPAGTLGPLERGLIKATNSGESFEGWVVGFYGEWSDTLVKLPEVIIKNLQNMHEKSLPPTGARRRMELAYQDWARLQGRGPRTGGVPADLSTAP